MRKKSLPLIKTNPYLQDPAECDAWLTRSVLSSTAIEGVHAAAARALGVAVKTKSSNMLRRTHPRKPKAGTTF